MHTTTCTYGSWTLTIGVLMYFESFHDMHCCIIQSPYNPMRYSHMQITIYSNTHIYEQATNTRQSSMVHHRLTYMNELPPLLHKLLQLQYPSLEFYQGPQHSGVKPSGTQRHWQQQYVTFHASKRPNYKTLITNQKVFEAYRLNFYAFKPAQGTRDRILLPWNDTFC